MTSFTKTRLSGGSSAALLNEAVDSIDVLGGGQHQGFSLPVARAVSLAKLVAFAFRTARSNGVRFERIRSWKHFSRHISCHCPIEQNIVPSWQTHLHALSELVTFFLSLSLLTVSPPPPSVCLSDFLFALYIWFLLCNVFIYLSSSFFCLISFYVWDGRLILKALSHQNTNVMLSLRPCFIMT